MEAVVLLVGIGTVVIAVAGLCQRFGLPAPLVLIAVGIAGSFTPFVPDVQLTADVALFGLLPPLLYSTALQTSLVDFNTHRRSIMLLSVGLVAFTTVGIGVLMHALLPDLGWPAALAVGAVVAPPDAVAATAIGRRIGLPRRVVTILEGESLFNDATALVALRTALAATVAWHVVALDFLLAAGGGLLVGLTAYLVVAGVRRRLTDPVLDSALSFVTPFAAYVAAEEVHASGVISVVVAGLLLGHRAPILQTAQSRIAERLNWRSIAFLLESAVFLLIGLQARSIIDGVRQGDVVPGRILLICALALLGVIVLRLVWVFPSRYLLIRTHEDPATGEVATWRSTLLIGWAGMRGVVTLAAAFVIPEDTPHRNLLLLVAFTVAAGTLFLQGLSLPWLARVLNVHGPDPASDALVRANVLHQASAAGLAELERLAEEDPHDVAGAIRERLRRRDHAAWESVGARGAEETPSATYARWRGEMLEAERRRVLEIRNSGSVPSEIVEQVLSLLDVEESMLDHAEDERGRLRAASTVAVPTDCDHLREERPAVEPTTPGECEECVAEGSTWVHLRMCEDCGHVGCCDSSERKHASRHFTATGHPVMRSAEPGDDWRWCYVDEVTGSGVRVEP